MSVEVQKDHERQDLGDIKVKANHETWEEWSS